MTMKEYVERIVRAFEAWAFLDEAVSSIFLIEHFQGVAFDRYECDTEGKHFKLRLIKDDEETVFTFSKEVQPDVLLASLQRYAREVSES